MSFQSATQLDFDIIGDTNNPEFCRYLKSTVFNLPRSEVSRYYKTLVSHFSNHIYSKIGNTILLCICKSLKENENVEVFAEEKLIEYLPYEQIEYRSQLFDLLYILVKKVPDIFTSYVASKISQMVETDPRKVFLLITYFSEHFNDVREPFPMVDILFLKADYFKSIECADDYITLLVYLLRNYQVFKDNRIEHCWTYVEEMLKLSNVAILNTCYYGLCAIAEGNTNAISNAGYPVSAITEHIKRRPLRQAAMALLIRYPPPMHTKHLSKILLALVDVAQEDERASFLLMALCMNGANAQKLLNNPQWMTKALPKTTHTMRLFIIIMLHEDLRKTIVETPLTVDFFRSLLTENSVGMCNAICTMLRRLPLTPDFVKQLSERGFLGAYFSSVLENENNDAILSALRLLDTVARVRYVPELSEMVDTIIRLIKSSSELALPAASVAIDMCKYPRCARLFKAKRLSDYFKQQVDNPKMKHYADRFLKVLSNVEQLF